MYMVFVTLNICSRAFDVKTRNKKSVKTVALANLQW